MMDLLPVWEVIYLPNGSALMIVYAGHKNDLRHLLKTTGSSVSLQLIKHTESYLLQSMIMQHNVFQFL